MYSKNRNNLNGAFYGRQTPTKYEVYKDRARDEAIEFSITSSAYNYSYGELVEKQNYFKKLAKRYGLTKEFKENGIC